MTAVALPNVGIKAGYQPLEDGWGQDMNKNLRLLDALLQAVVIDKDLTAPPGSPSGGDMYIVPASASGAWNSQTGKLAIWQTGDDLTGVSPIPAPSWAFVTPKEGWRVWVADEDLFYQHNGTAWIAKPEVDVTNVGINAQTGTTYSFVLADAGKVVRQSNAAAITDTLPTNAAVAFPVGTVFTVRQAGAGQITITPSGGVTLNIPTGYQAKSGRRYAAMMLHKVGTDEWDLTGDLST
jgi:hypothetical protein